MSKSKKSTRATIPNPAVLVAKVEKRKADAKATAIANTVWIVGTGQRVTFRNPAKVASFCERMRATGIKVHVGPKLPEKEKINAPS